MDKLNAYLSANASSLIDEIDLLELANIAGIQMDQKVFK